MPWREKEKEVINTATGKQEKSSGFERNAGGRVRYPMLHGKRLKVDIGKSRKKMKINVILAKMHRGHGG